MNHITSCIAPPPLTDVELAIYLDGEGEPRLAQHVHQCAACRSRALELARQQERLAATLYRSACPTPEELRDYQMDLLSRTDGSNIALHLARCPHCTRELFVLDEFLAQRASAANLTQRIKLMAARLTSGLSASSSQLALSGQRGDQSPMLSYQADELQIGLEFEDNLDSGAKNIKGLITGGELDNLVVHLWRDGRLVATAPVDSLLGDFEFISLAPASYELIISAQQSKFRIPQITV